jgi:hypothetical protein
MILQRTIGVRGKQVNELKVQQPHIALHISPVLVKYAREAPALRTSELQALQHPQKHHKRGNMVRGEQGSTRLALAQTGDKAARSVSAFDAVN